MLFIFSCCSLFVKLTHDQPFTKQGWSARMNSTPANISTSDQRCFNVADPRWNNIASGVENETKSDVWFSTLHGVDTKSVFDVETTLKQRWYNFISTLFRIDLSIRNSYLKTSRASDKYGLVNRQLSFILLNIFGNILTIQLLIN